VQNSSSNPIYCGPPGFGFRNWGLLNKKHSDINSYFEKASTYFVRKGRTAIRKACELLKLEPGSEILVPAYNCGSEIDAILGSGASVVLYRIDKNCRIDIGDIVRRITSKTKAIYIIHYFGFPQNFRELTSVSIEKKIPLIEDCALALFSKDGTSKLGMIGDLSIFSFPKTLPVPDGGALVVKDAKAMQFSWILDGSVTGESFLSLLPLLKATFLRSLSRWRMYHSKMYSIGWPKTHRNSSDGGSVGGKLNKMPTTYYYDDALTNKGISRTASYMLKMFDVDSIVQKRRNNFRQLFILLSESPCYEPLYKELPEGICPLNFPIVVRNRDSLTSKLQDLSIDACQWWKGYHPALSWGEFPEACFLKDNILTLPVHQDLNDKDIMYIAESFLRLAN
jgi:perosamine synthetase